MKLIVPFNWDLDLIDKLEDCPVDMYYAKLQDDVIGGGRTPRSIQNITTEFVELAISKMHSKGVMFNYLLNSLCLGNIEFDSNKRKQIFELLEWLSIINVDYVTVSNPYLALLIKTHFPQIKMACSIFTRIKTLRDAQRWDDLGFDVITLDYPVVRDFDLLKKIVKNISARIQLIANNVCLLNCPYAIYHGESLGHSSQKDYPYNNLISICRYYCRRDLYASPEEIIKAGWIRPEDLRYYEDIGIETFKFTDRIKPTWWIERTIKSYSSRSYHGNLLELFGSFKLDKKPIQKLPKAYITSLGDYHKRDINSSFDLNVYLDNNKLNGFINHFVNNNCNDVGCKNCSYCKLVSGAAFSCDALDQDTSIANLTYLIDKFNDIGL